MNGYGLIKKGQKVLPSAYKLTMKFGSEVKREKARGMRESLGSWHGIDNHLAGTKTLTATGAPLPIRGS